MFTRLVPTNPKLSPTIMKLLNFNQADLHANRAGILSKRQIKLAESSQPNRLIQMVLMGHVAVIIGILLLIVVASGVSSEKLLFLGVVSMVILSPFLVAMDRVTAIKKEGLPTEDITSGEVLSACGTLECFPPMIPTQSARIKIEGKSFRVPNAVTMLIDAETTYCVYYAAHSKRVVSLEALPEIPE